MTTLEELYMPTNANGKSDVHTVFAKTREEMSNASGTDDYRDSDED